jgi:hypothetical protein
VALRRAGCTEVDADEDRILVSIAGKKYVYKTPRNASLFIDDFDNGREHDVKPIDIVLENPKLATIADARLPLYSKVD